MISKNIYLQLALRIIFICLSALGLAFFWFGGQYVLFGLMLIILISVSFSLIHYVNQTNRKIAYFFDAIKNEDFTLRFPEKLSVKSLEELNHSLNMLNSMIQDIHLKKQAQEQYYQEIIKQAGIGILTFNKKGHILFANPRVEELFRHSPLNHIKQLSRVDAKLYQLFLNMKPFERKLVQMTNEREKKQIALKSTLLNLNKEELMLVVAQDIHQELDEKETDSWIKLIRVLTHEIMNTITPITSISESILKYFKTEGGGLKTDFKPEHIQNAAKGLEVIKDQGVDLMEFVQSYRSFLSLPAPDKEPVPAKKLLDKVVVLTEQENKNPNLVFETIAEPIDLNLFIDEKQISHVLINLCKNAVHSLSEVEDAKIRVMAGISAQGKKFIEVRDNGPGIPPELIDEIFVPFFTTKEKGSGIGLSLAKQIMQLHGGSIQVVSQENTVFTLIFE